MKIQPNILLISGSGQNTGKTTLVCKLITHLCKNTNIVAVKITHHFYTLTYQMLIIEENDEFKIYQEIEKNMPKDSSRMLNAGAYKVYYIMAKKENIGKAIELLLGKLSPDAAVICESGGLADFFKPGIHLHLKSSEGLNEKPLRVFDAEVSFNGLSFSLDIENIVFENNLWKLNKVDHDIS